MGVVGSWSVLEVRAKDSVVLETFEGSVVDDARGDPVVLECIVIVALTDGTREDVGTLTLDETDAG